MKICKVLIIDDDSGALLVTKKMCISVFKKLKCDFNIKTVLSSVEAVEILMKRIFIPDLILTDFLMPYRNGIDLKKFLNNDDIFSIEKKMRHVGNIPYYIISGSVDSVELRIEAKKAGIKGWGDKPVKSSYVKMIIKSIIEKD